MAVARTHSSAALPWYWLARLADGLQARGKTDYPSEKDTQRLFNEFFKRYDQPGGLAGQERVVAFIDRWKAGYAGNRYFLETEKWLEYADSYRKRARKGALKGKVT